MPELKFGTDGWRARMDADFTFENVEKVSQAFADTLKAARKNSKVAVGYDYRKNSENFAQTVAEVLAGNGIEVLLSTKASPTPSVSYCVVREHCQAGIMVTASHNPPDYNGIKIKTEYGGSADKTQTDAVERLIGKNPVLKSPIDSAGRVRRLDFNESYLDYLGKYIRLEVVRQSPYRILVDSMHGVCGSRIEDLLKGGKIRVETMRGTRDTSFGGNSPEPIPKNLTAAAEKMKTGGYDLCIVTDGDGDRVGALAPGGEFVSPGKILSLVLLHMVQDLGRKGSVVTTVSNTALIYRVARKLGLKIHETPVGFKYVCEIMRRENVLIGGEESGGIGFQDYLYERDGMLSGLLLVEMMAMRSKTFARILEDVDREFGKLFYVRRDMEYPDALKSRLFARLSKEPPSELCGQKILEAKNADGMKWILEDGSWLLFRLSGTEPILRIYSEATSQALAENLVQNGKELAEAVPHS